VVGSGSLQACAAPEPRLFQPDADRLAADIRGLASFHDPAAPGATRLFLSDPQRASRPWLAARMAEAGLAVQEDALGNLIGVLAGRLDGAPAIVTGSHTDSVRGGGCFDGVLGVLGAVEAVRVLRDLGVSLDHELRVVDFQGEEPNDFGLSCVGSRAITGTLAADHLRLADGSATTLGEALDAAGLRPSAFESCAWAPGSALAFVELHIEQGPVLELAGVTIGVVSGIVGVDRSTVTFTGRRDHAGTMPMGERHDAVCAAAEGILAAEALAGDGGGVATTGRLEVAPGSVNVVPDLARLSLEVRSVDEAWLDDRRRRIVERMEDAGARRGVEVVVTPVSHEPPTPAHPGVRRLITEAAASTGATAMQLPSGAEHDARQMARLAPMGMIFVPSRGGRSHCPEEDTDTAHAVAGVATLAATLVALDSRFDEGTAR
jgi:N-carbamoyl-L-amino-acid hydrolase